MSTLVRSARIYLTFARYRLDDLLPARFRRTPLRLALLPWRLFSRPPGSRGARLRQALEDLGPIFVKFGQLLSTRPDLLPVDMLGELNRLQDNVTPFDSAEFKAVVEKALGGPTETIFAEFSESPLASASIAQVHTARLPDGTDVVVKAVRPNIGKVIRQDVALMERIAQLLNKYVPELRRLRPVEVVREYRETIFDELDLLREAANASQLRRLWQGSPLLYVPEVYWDYCRPNVMVMERIYGTQVTDLAEFHRRNVDIKVLAERGVEIFFTQVFEHNFFHADMHPGNVYVDASDPAAPSYISLDMAIIGTLSREDQFYLARNLLAMFRRDYRQVAELHVMSGWVPPGTSIGNFEAAIRTVCEPIFQKPIKDIAFGDALVKLFQTARRFDMPVQPQLVLLQKTLVNIEGLGRQLYPDLDLWATAKPFLERWVKKRFNPIALFREVSRQGPDFAERAPQLPAVVWDSLNGMRRLSSTAPALEAASLILAEEAVARPKRQRRRLIGIVALSLGVWRSLPEGSAVPLDSLALVGVGLLALLLT